MDGPRSAQHQDHHPAHTVQRRPLRVQLLRQLQNQLHHRRSSHSCRHDTAIAHRQELERAVINRKIARQYRLNPYLGTFAPMIKIGAKVPLFSDNSKFKRRTTFSHPKAHELHHTTLQCYPFRFSTVPEGSGGIVFVL